MLVELGPVLSTSARSWVAHARDILASPCSAEVTADVRREFELFLDDVERHARQGDELRMSVVTTHEELSFLVHAFYRVAMEASACAGPDDRMSPSAVAFYRVLVRSVLGALSSECAASAEFAEDLASFWPGIHPAEALGTVGTLVGRSGARRTA